MANCKICLHAAVCSRRIATGGLVKKCEHFLAKKQGRWSMFRNGFGQCFFGVTCSECNTTWDDESNFCPHCGADMRGETDAN